MSAPVVLGLDLSLTSPAAVIAASSWRPGDWSARDLRWDTLKTERTGVGRLVEIRAWLEAFLERGPSPTHCYVEDYAYNMTSRRAALGEACGVVQVLLWERMDVRCEPVPASTARKTLLGKIRMADLVGAKLKDYVSAQVAKMGAQFATQDEVDAFVVMNHGRMLLGLSHVGIGP